MQKRAMLLPPHGVAVYGAALLATGLALLVRLLLRPYLGEDAPLLIFTLAVMFAASRGGLWPGMAATLLSALAGKLLFLPAIYSLRFERSHDVVRVILFLAIGASISLLNERLHAARRQAEAVARELAQSREELAVAYAREHRVAEALQSSLVRKPDPNAFPGLIVELFYETPSQETIGGDFYDALPLPEGRAALVVGDVSGKGMTAAARIAEIKFAVRAFLRESPYPAHTLRRLNHLLCETQTLEARGAGTFVSLALAVIDPRTGEVLASLAGAEPPLVIRGADKEAEVLELGGLPLGADCKIQEPYPSQALHLEIGDTLLIFTDGLTEAGHERGEMLDHPGVGRLAREAVALPTLHEMGQAILNGVHEWAGGTLSDDACLLLVRRR
jgi:serine phosphatase RsbU (regulator of sigma subunit)